MSLKEFSIMMLFILPAILVFFVFAVVIAFICTWNCIVGIALGIIGAFFLLFGLIKYIDWVVDKTDGLF